MPLMQRCLAVIFPSRDDFGLLPLEVMACGRPVLAYAEGGACHTVPGVSGALFLEQTPEALLVAISSFSPSDYDPLGYERTLSSGTVTSSWPDVCLSLDPPIDPFPVADGGSRVLAEVPDHHALHRGLIRAREVPGRRD